MHTYFRIRAINAMYNCTSNTDHRLDEMKRRIIARVSGMTFYVQHIHLKRGGKKERDWSRNIQNHHHTKILKNPKKEKKNDKIMPQPLLVSENDKAYNFQQTLQLGPFMPLALECRHNPKQKDLFLGTANSKKSQRHQKPYKVTLKFI